MSIFENLPDGTTHISTVNVQTSSGGRLRANIYAFKLREDGEWLQFATDNDNEYAHWCEAKKLYCGGRLPDLHCITGL